MGANEQTEYRVTWDIDLTADSPEDAARQAEAYMTTKGARTYWVTPWKPGESEPKARTGAYVDLDTLGGHPRGSGMA